MFASAALAGNLILLVRFHETILGKLAGCGGIGGCLDSLESRWSRVLGVPVTLPGALICALLIISLRWRLHGFTALVLSILGLGTLWFIWIQLWIMQRLCAWCMLVHFAAAGAVVCGMLHLGSLKVARRRKLRAFCAGVFFVLIFALLQFTLPGPDSRRVTDAPQPVAGSDVHAGTGQRLVSFDEGRKVFDVMALPRIGPADAKHVMVEYFDYQCAACRALDPFLKSLMAKHSSEICLIVLPVPLDRSCNPGLPASDAGHPGACASARVALAVWKTEPSRFPLLHESFLADPPPDEAAALRRAAKWVPLERLESVMSDPWLDRLIAANISDWQTLSGANRTLPKLWIRDRRILHGLPAGQLDFTSAIENELGLAP